MKVLLVVAILLAGACTGPETGLLSCEEAGIFAPACLPTEGGATICISHPVCKDGTSVRRAIECEAHGGLLCWTEG